MPPIRKCRIKATAAKTFVALVATVAITGVGELLLWINVPLRVVQLLLVITYLMIAIDFVWAIASGTSTDVERHFLAAIQPPRGRRAHVRARPSLAVSVTLIGIGVVTTAVSILLILSGAPSDLPILSKYIAIVSLGIFFVCGGIICGLGLVMLFVPQRPPQKRTPATDDKVGEQKRGRDAF